jgi:hypothetical protein
MKSPKVAQGLIFSANGRAILLAYAGFASVFRMSRAGSELDTRNVNCKTVARSDQAERPPCEEDRHCMEIRFVSSLTPEDENLFAPALLKAIGALLDQLPIAYTIRIETTGSQVFQHTHTGPSDAETTRDPAGAAPRPIDGAIGFAPFHRLART